MFVHETHNFFILVTLNSPAHSTEDVKAKRLECIVKAIINIGGEAVGNHPFVWMLNNVMFSASEDVYDIVANEIHRIVMSDKSIPEDNQKLYLLDSDYDKVIVAEYNGDNIFTK